MPFITCHNKHAINKIKRQVELCKKKLKKRTHISQKNLEYIKNCYNSVRIQTIPFKNEKKILTLQNADI